MDPACLGLVIRIFRISVKTYTIKKSPYCDQRVNRQKIWKKGTEFCKIVTLVLNNQRKMYRTPSFYPDLVNAGNSCTGR